MRDDPVGFRDDYWKQGAELGWTSLLVSEADGGGTVSGRAVPDLALVAYEFGQHAAPGPLVPGAVVAGALSRGGTDEQKGDVLAGLLDGRSRRRVGRRHRPGPSRHRRCRGRGRPSGDGFRLSGVTGPVEAGARADWLLVTARTGDGLTQFLVPGDSAGITRRPLEGIDLTRRFANLAFEGAEVGAASVVGDVGGGRAGGRLAAAGGDRCAARRDGRRDATARST